jgi:hypothetical protein
MNLYIANGNHPDLLQCSYGTCVEFDGNELWAYIDPNQILKGAGDLSIAQGVRAGGGEVGGAPCLRFQGPGGVARLRWLG